MPGTRLPDRLESVDWFDIKIIKELEMSVKSLFGLIGKYLLLCVLFFVAFAVAGVVLPFSANLPAPPEGSDAAVALGMLLMVATDVAVMTVIILTSRLRGWRLALVAGVALYGVTTFMSQIETAWFGPALGIPAEDMPLLLPGLMLPMLLALAVFSPLAVLVLGRWPTPESGEVVAPVRMSAGQWTLKLAAIALAYLVLYFGFGMLVAWQNPALREMYGNGGNQQVFNFAALIPLQIVRSALWMLFALPVIRHMRGKGWQVALLVGVLYALPMNVVHAIPNAWMPDPSVRLSHFIETASSNFIFGLVVTWLVIRRHASLRDLLGLRKPASAEPVTA